jgi:hypothetical protein
MRNIDPWDKNVTSAVLYWNRRRGVMTDERHRSLGQNGKRGEQGVPGRQLGSKLNHTQSRGKGTRMREWLVQEIVTIRPNRRSWPSCLDERKPWHSLEMGWMLSVRRGGMGEG